MATKKKEEKKEIIIGYRLEKNIGIRIYNYLQTRPMSEVDYFCINLFESNEKNEKVFKKQIITDLIYYLKDKCPRKEIIGFINDLNSGGILCIKKQINEQNKNIN